MPSRLFDVRRFRGLRLLVTACLVGAGCTSGDQPTPPSGARPPEASGAPSQPTRRGGDRPERPQPGKKGPPPAVVRNDVFEGEIAFSRLRKGSPYGDVYVVPADGSRIDPVATGLRPNDVWGSFTPAWFPDGRRLVFSAERGRNNLYVVRRSGKGLRALTRGGVFGDHTPSVSADGRFVVFEREHSEWLGVSAVDLDHQGHQDGMPIGRPVGNAQASEPSLAPDGRRVVVQDEGGGRSFLVVVALESGRKTRIVSLRNGAPIDPAWSPSGEQIAFSLIRDDDRSLWVVGADGTGLRQLTSESVDQTPQWSPDGRTISFVRVNERNADIYTIEDDGSSLRQLTHTTGLDCSPTWSPMGDAIAFVSARRGDHDIYLMRPDGSEQTLLAGGRRGIELDPTWRPSPGNHTYPPHPSRRFEAPYGEVPRGTHLGLQDGQC